MLIPDENIAALYHSLYLICGYKLVSFCGYKLVSLSLLPIKIGVY